MVKIAIYGYGNLAKGIETALKAFPDMELCAVFTRRKGGGFKPLSGAPVYAAEELSGFSDSSFDVVIPCVSSPDLFAVCPRVLEKFCTVDAFDMHARLSEYVEVVDRAAKRCEKTAFVAGGWDPGALSLARVYAESFLPDGKSYTFWGKGVSQGHTAAIKRVKGVADGKQYTLPNRSAIERIRAGETPDLTVYDMHERECLIVVEQGADRERIEREIKSMPVYFQGYTTRVRFITAEELKEKHQGFPHGGKVVRVGRTGENIHTVEYSLALSSNPEFTGSVLLACARAVYTLYKQGTFGAKTALDIPPVYYSGKTRENLIETLL